MPPPSHASAVRPPADRPSAIRQASTRTPAVGRRRRGEFRRGHILVLFAMSLVLLMGLLAIVIDLGAASLSKDQLRVAADAGALGGLGTLRFGANNALVEGRRFADVNLHGAGIRSAKVDAELGLWIREQATFMPNATESNALRLTIRRDDAPMFFGRMFRDGPIQTRAASIAAFRPRDVELVLDRSGSMYVHERIEIVRQAVLAFLDVVARTGVYDRVGLTIYDSQGRNVLPLTSDHGSIQKIVAKLRPTQSSTNLAHGMLCGYEDLYQNHRDEAQRLMIVLTDGEADHPQYALELAQEIADDRIQIVTITVGADAERSLMRRIASIGGGDHHHVDEGDYAQMERIFHDLALRRSAQLVE